MLSTVFDVREYRFDSSRTLALVRELVRQFLFLISAGGRTDTIICMFAGYHSLLPALVSRVRGIPCFVIAGGTDSVKYPSISYGNFTKTVYGWFTALSFKMCSTILPVHETLARFENEYYGGAEKRQGFLEHVPGLKTPYLAIPNGFESIEIPPVDFENRSGFLTVATIPSRSRFVLKGIDLVYEVAPRFPEHRFTIVGMNYDPGIPKPANVEVFGRVEHDRVIDFLLQAKFYLQLSISEGHPNALCEAMLVGCIPIGSAVGAIPDSIGATGFVLKQRDVDLLEETLRQALRASRELSENARRRVASMYPLSKRRESMVKVITAHLRS